MFVAVSSSTCLQVAVVTVGYPATPVLLARARICISASHTREDLIKGLKVRVSFLWSLLFRSPSSSSSSTLFLWEWITQVISEVGGLVGAKCLPAEPEKAKKMDWGKPACLVTVPFCRKKIYVHTSSEVHSVPHWIGFYIILSNVKCTICVNEWAYRFLEAQTKWEAVRMLGWAVRIIQCMSPKTTTLKDFSISTFLHFQSLVFLVTHCEIWDSYDWNYIPSIWIQECPESWWDGVWLLPQGFRGVACLGAFTILWLPSYIKIITYHGNDSMEMIRKSFQ